MLADAGADIVVGSHAHVVQGSGLLGATFVAYGLGNFVWYNPGSDDGSVTGLLTLTVDVGKVVAEQWLPARIQSDGLPRFADDADAQTLTTELAQRRECADLAGL